MNAAACMTKELAESGSEFVITIINECDLVPCFSSGSLDDLRAEVDKIKNPPNQCIHLITPSM